MKHRNIELTCRKTILIILLLLSITSTVYAIKITDPPKDLTVNNTVGESRTFKIIIDHSANVTWKINNTVIPLDADETNNVTISTYINESASLGTWIIRATAINTSNSNDKTTRKWTWLVANVSPSDYIAAPNISGVKSKDITYSTAKITFDVNQSDARTIVRYGTTRSSLEKRSEWNNNTGSSRTIDLFNLDDNKTYFYSVYAYNGTDQRYYKNSTIYSFKTNKLPENYYSGNRIWDGTKNMGTTYTWNSSSFAGFYYGLDENLGTEELTIKDIKRTINKGYITYKTSPVEVDFDYSNFGKYHVIGFMADKYFAGYTTNSKISGKKDISTIGSGQLHKVLLDDNNQRVISEGGTLTLGEGYVLKAKEVDIGAGKGQVWITLLKDGNEVDNGVVESGGTYIYQRRIGNIESLPIIAVYIDSVFRGKEVNAAFVKGVFQISDSYTEIKSGTRYSKMEISSFGRDKITMENRETIDLSSGSTIDLMGNLKIMVANSDTLRFALSVERTGTFEVRGTVYNTTDEWTPFNFGLNIAKTNIGFYYDIDEDIGTEKLKIDNIDGRTIQKGKLIYSTSPQKITFNYQEFGKYYVIGLMAKKYFAGYSSESIISNRKDIDTIGNGQLHEVVLDDDDKRTITEGGTLTLKNGYALKMTDVDIGSGTGQIWVTLLKDGNEVDSGVVAGGKTYIYQKRVGNVELPIIAIYFDSVFRGREVNAAFVKGIFQISDSYSEIKSGNKYGRMEIYDVSKNKIAMRNDNSISLSSGSTIDVMGNIKFKVANSDNLRFYPFVLVTQEILTGQLYIDAPPNVMTGDIINIKVTAGGTAIEGVSITIEPEIGPIGKTDNRGILTYTIPISSKGIYNITADKIDYYKASKTIEISQYIDNRLYIDMPIMANQYDTMAIRIVHNNTAISGVAISYDNMSIGTTNNNGILNYTLQLSGNHTVTASKVGYATTAREIYVKEPYSEFKAIDINIIPNKVFENEKVLVTSNITNVGTKEDTTTIWLTVDDIVADSKSIALSPKYTKEINFTYKVSTEGNYTIKILGQEGLLEVKKGHSNSILIAVIATIIGIAVIYIVTTKDKIAELIRKIYNR